MNRKIILAAVVVIILLGGSAIFTFINRRGKVALTVSVIPKEASITINGELSKPGTLYLKPGDYEIVASLDGFKNRTASERLSSSKEIVMPLTPITPEAIELSRKYSTEYLEFESSAGTTTQLEGKTLLDSNPLIGNLPHSTSYYSINYRNSEDGGIVIEISADSALGRQVALEKIRGWGYSLGDYRFMFVGFTNPFLGVQINE